MLLRDWRTEKALTLREVAEALAIGEGANPSRSMQRVETGEALADADLIDRIAVLTDGAVSALDMQAARLNWLRENRPEKFEQAATVAA